LYEGKSAVNSAEEKSYYPEMASIIKKREKSGLKAAKRADAQNELEEKECSGARGADD